MKRKVLMIGLIGALALAGCGGTAETKETESASGTAASSSSEEASSVSGSSAEETVSSSETAASSSAEETSSVSGSSAEETASSSETAASSSEETASSSAEASSAAEEEQDPILAIPTISGEYTIDECVELGEYKGLDLTMEVEEVTEEDIDSYIEYLVEPVETDDPEAVVQEGDVVNLDYEGKLDGEPFDGGTSQGYDLEIGSGTFIPGFEDGIIGMKAGETKDLELTFPESYVENLAGKDVVFTVTVNAIKHKPELDDAWVLEYTDGENTTLEEFREATRQDLEQQQKDYAENMLKSEAWQEVLDGAEILAFPEELLKESADSFDEYVSGEAEMYGMELEAYLEQMGMNMEAYENYRDSAARNDAKNRLVLEALTEAEGLTADSQEYKDAMAELAEMYGMSEEELRESYGDETIDQAVYSEVLMDKVISYANVSEKTAGEE